MIRLILLILWGWTMRVQRRQAQWSTCGKSPNGSIAPISCKVTSQVLALLLGQSDRAANGSLTMGQMMKGHTTGHRNFFSRLFHPRARVTGGTSGQRKLYREAIKKVFGSEHGGDYLREIDLEDTE